MKMKGECQMFCTKCGAEMEKGADSCPKCGSPRPLRIANHMTGAILCTVFCCCPMGIAAVVYAGKVNTKLAQGDIAGALEASRIARRWIVSSVVAGILVAVANGLFAAARIGM